MNNIIIIGGDKRQKELKNILTDMGYKCAHISSADITGAGPEIEKGDIIVLPIPVSKDKENIYSSDSDFRLKINDALAQIDNTNSIFGGNISNAIRAYAKERKVTCFDYLKNDEFVEYNSYLTGLAALRLLFESTCEDVKNKKVLITGFGKVAKYTAKTIKSAECDVYVTARSSHQLMQADCSGYKTIEFRKKNSFLYLFDYIFNTVPENIFSYEDVNHIKGKYFELASSPYGVRKDYFIGREKDYIFGGSIPGRYLPFSAAEKLAEVTVKQMNLRNGGD